MHLKIAAGHSQEMVEKLFLWSSVCQLQLWIEDVAFLV